ncbi:MAG: YraN family protein [Micavibrio aeruginosavorus]|uniref:UPF0102 protein DI626_11895 n=1 Tax=Micavibrio aeruginosavorus TaxID=349221 RepID=A0A2W4ZAV3_9BACT|nr:MAG: YraN family protein [Micavibrio aeruginosavorus]
MTVERKRQTHDHGVLAEGAAEIFLRAKGYEILERRYKTPVGEIDLIARHKEFLVFIEVKGRPSIEEALFALTPRMRGRITDAAGHYIASHPECADSAMRFDVMAVKLPFSVHHLENAWMG